MKNQLKDKPRSRTFQQTTGLRIRFFHKQLNLSSGEFGGAKFVEALVTDFILTTIELEWGIPVQYHSSIKYLPENKYKPAKFVTIQATAIYGNDANTMAELEARIGYTHAKTSIRSRSSANSTTPFDPNALHIEYHLPDKSQLQNDFDFKHFYSGHLFLEYGRGTYTIKLCFPEGYYDPKETVDQLPDSWRGIPYPDMRWSDHLILEPSVQQSEKTIKDIVNLKGTLYKNPATLMYANKFLKPGTPSKRRLGMPIEGGQFPYLYQLDPEALFCKKPAEKIVTSKLHHQDVEFFETNSKEEKQLFWAEIQQHGQPITPRFPHFSTEVIESLLNMAQLSYDDSGSLRAVLYNRDGETIQCIMKLQVWPP